MSRTEDELLEKINAMPCYISFYTGYNGEGGALRQTLYSERDHNDKILARQADKMAKELGAKSWWVYKPWGMPGNVYYEDENE